MRTRSSLYFSLMMISGSCRSSDLPRPAASRPKRRHFCGPIPTSFLAIRTIHFFFATGTASNLMTAVQNLSKNCLLTADPEDELSQAYPIGPQSFAAPAVNFDPGRYRCAALFKKMYGETAKEVESHLTTIRWLPHSTQKVVRISRVNGVDHQLEAVSAELDQLPPEEKKYVLKTGGTFNWRPIAGSDQLSAHAFGIAIDIDPDYSDYWHWDIGGDHGKLIPYKNRIPHQIVEIFERHGFIWGGKWYHYDTMHFEYRPELLPPGSK